MLSTESITRRSIASTMQVEKKEKALWCYTTTRLQRGRKKGIRSEQQTGLLLCLTCAEMMSEGKTYSKKLIKMVQLGKNDQLFVQRRGTNEMVGQYFCDKGKCNISDCQDCFKIQSGYLVLILHNISHLDRFDANLNGGTPFLQNFSLDEDVSQPKAKEAGGRTHRDGRFRAKTNHPTTCPLDPIPSHLQLNLAKTELLILPANPSLQHDFTIQLDSSSITPSGPVRNLGVIFDDQLTFIDHISKTARSCRFALHNIRKIRPFLTEHATQLLVQALVISRLDYCNALLAGLPSCATKPLQMIQNAAARLVFNEPKRAHVTPLFISLHWLPLAARIKFKALTLAYRSITGSVHSLLRVYIPTRSLRSVNERRLVVPSQRATKSLSRTFSFTVPCWWNALPTLIQNAESMTTFK
ncbi:unnamed protein product [Leuciscus chuanchicus]